MQIQSKSIQTLKCDRIWTHSQIHLLYNSAAWCCGVPGEYSKFDSQQAARHCGTGPVCWQKCCFHRILLTFTSKFETSRRKESLHYRGETKYAWW